MSNWKKHKLGDLASIQTGPFGSQLHAKDYIDKGIPVIMPVNIVDNKLCYDGTAQIGNHDAERLKRHQVKEGEIIFSRRGEIERRALVKKEHVSWLCGTGCLKVTPNEMLIDPEFLYYRLGTEEVKDWLYNHAVGATMPNLNTEILSNLPIDAPSLVEQKRIVTILSALDDKITLNRRMNQTLEEMAQALFKKYFVDDIDSYNLPKGWSYGTLGDIIDIKHGFAFRGEYFSDVETSDILLTPGNFKIGGGFNQSKYKFYNGESPSEYVFEAGDLIVTMTDLSKGGDTLGYSALVPSIDNKRLLHNQRIGKVLYKASCNLKFYLYWLMRMDDYRNFILGGATGTTVKHTSPSRICEFKCIIPSEQALRDFNSNVESLYYKELLNDKESQSLSGLRDTLLPKLMSGELDVSTLHQNELLYEPVLS